MILHVVERGAGMPLVLLHGLFGRAANFGTVQRMLVEKFRVLAIDLRNHGAESARCGNELSGNGRRRA